MGFDPFKAFGIRLNPFQRVDVNIVFLAVAFTDREQAIAAFRPDEFDDFDFFADDFGMKRALHPLGDHRQQAGVLLVLVVTINGSLLNQIEELFEGIAPAGGAVSLALEPETFDVLLNGLQSMVQPLIRRGLLPVSILCRTEVRQAVSGFLRGISGPIGVITFEELDPQISVEQVGIWTM